MKRSATILWTGLLIGTSLVAAPAANAARLATGLTRVARVGRDLVRGRVFGGRIETSTRTVSCSTRG